MLGANTSVVIIPLDRYEELVQMETRVNVVVERMYHDEFASREEILSILGTELSVELAEEIREEARKTREEYEKRLKEKAE